ncbi:hypothetical protein JCM10296v2_006454 [Rhodotorula toruloides]
MPHQTRRLLILFTFAVLAATSEAVEHHPRAQPTSSVRLAERGFWCGVLGLGCSESSAAASGLSATASGAAATGSAASSSGTLVSGTSDASASITSASMSATSGLTSSALSTSMPSVTSSTLSSTNSLTSSMPSSRTSSSSAVSIVTITSVVTNSDGSSSTMLQESASAVPVKNETSSGPSGKTWGIIGGVIGGVAVVVVGCLLFWRLTQRRFSNLDHDIGEIKWPELQPDGGETNLSTLNPSATRKTGGAGVEMEKDREFGYDTDEEEFGRPHAGGAEWDAGSPRLGYGPNGSEQFYERGGGPRAQSPYELAYAGGGAGAYGGTYYDPYLGTPAASHLPPGAAATATDPFANPPTTNNPYPSAPPTLVYPPPSHQHPSYPNPFTSSADDVPLTAAQVSPAGSPAAATGGGIPYNARAGAMSPGPRY